MPGIGPAAREKLAEKGITTTYALFGQFLLLKEEGSIFHSNSDVIFFFIGVGPVEHCDRFWYWLKAAGINSNRSGIVQCVAEKLDTTFPGLYDGSMYRK